MGGVLAALEALQVVAVVEVLGDDAVVGRGREHLVIRQQRWLSFAHVREDDPALFQAGVSLVADVILETAAGGFCGGLEAPAVHVVEPAVVHAAEAAVLDPSVAQVCGSMRAVQIEQADSPVRIAEHDQVFAEQPQRDRRPARWEFLTERGWLPVASEQLATGSPRASLGQQVILFLREHRKTLLRILIAGGTFRI